MMPNYKKIEWDKHFSDDDLDCLYVNIKLPQLIQIMAARDKGNSSNDDHIVEVCGFISFGEPFPSRN